MNDNNKNKYFLIYTYLMQELDNLPYNELLN